MSRRRFQSSLFGLLFATFIVAVACTLGPAVVRQAGHAGVGSFVLTAIITGPLYFIAFYWFKDVFKDFGVGLKLTDTRLSRYLPDKIHVPQSPSNAKRPIRRRRRPIRTASWWHPLGGYDKQ